MPYEDKNTSLCNYYCPSNSHQNKNFNFCSSPAWHSNSNLAKDHNFECHDFNNEEGKFEGIDICFCIDTTASM